MRVFDNLMRQYVHYWSRNTAWNAFIHELATWVIEQGIVVQQIPAPTFEEQERAVHVVKQFEAFGLKDTSIDPQLNAYGRLAGRNKGVKALMVVALIPILCFPAKLRSPYGENLT